MSEFDTIVAPATPIGRGALAIVRVDGPATLAVLRGLTRDVAPAPRHAVFARLWSDGGELLDECVVVRFEAPHSFTGNDLAELTLHGNPVIVDRVLSACLSLGARIAEAGEFSERAVLNGKIDLVQAESIADLINSRTVTQAQLSLANLEGHLSRKANGIREILLDAIARVEARLDFSEEGYEFIGRDELRGRLTKLLIELKGLRDTFRRGRATASGLSAVILGRPNAGKSTLLNRLVGSDRAIVTPIPGTTRDIVTETIEIGGLPVILADTAGLRPSDDFVEGIGMDRARQAARNAEIVLYLVDGSVGILDEDRRELEAFPANEQQVVFRVFTKSDLAPAPEGELSISVPAEHGVAELLQRLDEIVRDRFAASDAALVNQRQMQAVAESEDAVRATAESIEAGLDEEIIAVDLRRAANALAHLTGAITRDDVLAEIFGKFCIGK